MGKLKETQYVDIINFSDVKPGQYVTIKNSENELECYVVVVQNKKYILIPVDLKACRIGNDSMIITNVFDAKNGNCLIHLKG